MRHYLFAVVVLLALQSPVIDVYSIHLSISESELKSLYVDMLSRFTKYAERQWHTLATEPMTGYWGNGISDGNEGIRAIANTALTYAVLAKHTNKLSSTQKEAYIKRALAGLRYAVNTHITGSSKCVDGKQWGNSWQSAMWAGNLGFAAWILQDYVDDELRNSVERVTSYEADRFLGKKPLGNRWSDTKAEELGWDLICIAVAANMMPTHPHAAAWNEKCIEWMMNVLSVPRDHKDDRIVDGKPVREWVSTVNVHPDFTIENHGFFHPSYTMVSPAEVGQGAFLYAYAGKPIPKAAGHHLLDNWRLLQNFMQPCGYWMYPQGMDWALNSDGHIHYLAWLATYAKDSLAYGMEKRVAQYIAGHQTIHGGERFAGPASRLGFAREAVTAERISYAYLYHKYLTPPTEARTIEQISHVLNGVKRYSFVDLITHRTNSKFASFSWKNQVMGLVMPIQWHKTNPYFATPITDGLVGTFSVRNSPRERPQVLTRKWRKLENGFETNGTLLTNGGALKQDLCFISVGEKTVAYVDRITALKDVYIEQERGVPIGVENDEFTGDRRVLYYENGKKTITGKDTEGLILVSGSWANVDGRLGVVSVLGSGIAYQDAGHYNRDGAREDFLYASYSEKPRALKAGDEVVRRVAVFFVETSPEETCRLAEKIWIEHRAGREILHMELPEGGEYEVSLI